MKAMTVPMLGQILAEVVAVGKHPEMVCQRPSVVVAVPGA
jgi:hypothetical protein